MQSNKENTGCVLIFGVVAIIGLIISFTGVGAIVGIPMALIGTLLFRLTQQGLKSYTCNPKIWNVCFTALEVLIALFIILAIGGFVLMKLTDIE